MPTTNTFVNGTHTVKNNELLNQAQAGEAEDPRAGPSCQPDHSAAQFTIARAVDGGVLAKALRQKPDGSYEAVSSYGKAKYFNYKIVEIAGLDDLEKALRTLSADKQAAILYGCPKTLGGPQLRRSKDSVEGGQTVTATLTETQTRLAVIDVDDVPPWAGDVRMASISDLVDLVCSLLPIEFRIADCLAQLTSGHGLTPGKIKMRLFFLVDRKMALTEMRAWLAGSAADLSVLRPTQLIYTAAPLFASGADPIGERWFKIERPFSEFVSPPAHLPAWGLPKAHMAAQARSGDGRATSTTSGSGWRWLLDQCDPHFFPHIQSAVASFVRTEGPDADPAHLFDAIDAVLQKLALPARGPDYVATRRADARSWFARCVDLERTRRSPQLVDWDEALQGSKATFVLLDELRTSLEAAI